jgi:hypothetical protein
MRGGSHSHIIQMGNLDNTPCGGQATQTGTSTQDNRASQDRVKQNAPPAPL